jgi:hypothetical protein
MALNLDLAPTILDLAGQPVPPEMQGRSLKPFIENEIPADWRDSFFFSYTDDPEYTGSIADFIGLRFEDGRKLVHYALDTGWDEFYKTEPTGSGADQYELSNLIAAPSEEFTVATMKARLNQVSEELGFLRQLDFRRRDPLVMDVQAGATYPFLVETSTNLQAWTTASTFEGSGESQMIDLIAGSTASWDLTVAGDAADYSLIEGDPVTANRGLNTLRCGASTGVGQDAVLVFELPLLPAGKKLALAQLEITARRSFTKWWEADLWALGIKGDTAPILEYHGKPTVPRPAGMVKLQEAIFDVSVPSEAGIIRSSQASGLSAYLRAFYEANPGYTGGQYLFLRINPEKLDMSSEGNERYEVFASENAGIQSRPKLNLSWQSQLSESSRFWRIRYGAE